MPKKNNNIAYDELSIHSFVDGFSFCKDSGADFLPCSKNTPKTFKQAFEDFIGYYHEGRFEKISWLIFEVPALFVPKELYLSEKKEKYLDFFFPRKEGQKLRADFLGEALGIYTVYCIEKAVEDFLFTKRKEITIRHSNSTLLETISARLTEYESRGKFYIHLQKGSFELFYFKENVLQLCNRFKQNDVKSFLYFLFFVVEQSGLSNAEYTIIFLGKFQGFNAYYKGVEDYHDSVLYLEAEGFGGTLSIEEHPAPFLSNIFS